LMQLRQPQGQQQLGGLVQGLDNATIPSGSDTMWNTSPSDAQYPQQGSE
jgi:hypothetical protein